MEVSKSTSKQKFNPKKILADANFKGTLPPGYFLEDTSKITNKMPSFGITSEIYNQKILVVIWDTDAPANQLELLTHKVPFTDFALIRELKNIQVAEGQDAVAGQNMRWFVGRYKHTADKSIEEIMSGAYKLPDKYKAVVVIAQPYKKGSQVYDYKTAVWLLDVMSSEPIQQESNKVAGKEQALKTDFRNNVESIIREKYRPPKESAKAKISVLIGINKNGMLNKIEITSSSEIGGINQAVIKALNQGQPYPKPSQDTELQLNVDGNKVEVK